MGTVLSESAKEYGALLHSLGAGVLVADLASKRFVYANPDIARFLGYSEEELVQLAVPDIHPKADLPLVVAAFEAQARGERKLFTDIPCLRKDGQVVFADISSVKVELGGAACVAGVFIDVTARQCAEEALRESEFRLQALSDNLPGGLVYQIDTGLDGRQRRFTYVSAGVVSLHGVTAEQALQDAASIYGQILDEDRVALVELEEQAVASLSSFSAEARVRTAGGGVRWSLFTSAPRRMPNGHVLWDGIELDITRRKRFEEELQEKSQLQLLLMEITSSYLGLPVERIDAAIQESLGKLARFVGADRAYVFDYDFHKQITVNTHEWCADGITPQITQLQAVPLSLIADWVQAHRRGEALHIPDVSALAPGGAREVLERQDIQSLLVVPILWAQECMGFVGFDSVRARHAYSTQEQQLLTVFAQNLLSLKRHQRAEEEKARLEAQLRQAQKLESVGRLAGGVAHDFNNMLCVILGHSDMALAQLDRVHPLYSGLEQIRSAATHSADLTRQLLAFARKQTIAPQVLSLNETVTATIKMLTRLIGEDVELRFHAEEGLWPVRVDPSQVDQILANLCLNSRDAIAGVGHIVLETHNCTVEKAFCQDHPGASPGDYVRLTVCDDGHGMDEAVMARLFEPFFTTKEIGKGTGLGLATVYGAVQQNKGFIDVQSQPGKGATFGIYLPRHAAPGEALKAAGPPPSVARGHEAVLVVEDEPAVLALAVSMLQRHGYRVVAAQTPQEALRQAREHSGEIDLLVTDVIMPEMNGRELSRCLLSLFPKLRSLFMSGYTADIVAPQGVLEPGVAFLQKPFSAQELIGKVQEVLDRR
ncbi:MAG TPA: PAS domain S-box protein [Myxococcales bacterium]|jgi:PAS domain S-box-containing protein